MYIYLYNEYYTYIFIDARPPAQSQHRHAAPMFENHRTCSGCSSMLGVIRHVLSAASRVGDSPSRSPAAIGTKP